MTGEVERKIDFEERKSCFKNEVEDFFKNIYKNPNGCEDGIEVCLVRAGYRTVLSAEEKINSQEAEIERLKKRLAIAEDCIWAVEDALYRGSHNDYAENIIEEYDKVIKEME